MEGRGGQGWEGERQSKVLCKAAQCGWSPVSLPLRGTGEPMCVVPAAALPMESEGPGVAVASLRKVPSWGPALRATAEIIFLWFM